MRVWTFNNSKHEQWMFQYTQLLTYSVIDRKFINTSVKSHWGSLHVICKHNIKLEFVENLLKYLQIFLHISLLNMKLQIFFHSNFSRWTCKSDHVKIPLMSSLKKNYTCGKSDRLTSSVVYITRSFRVCLLDIFYPRLYIFFLYRLYIGFNLK